MRRNAARRTVVLTVGTSVLTLVMLGLELIFNYPGLGRLILNAVRSADYPLLRGGVLIVAIIYMAATLVADLIIAWMNPRARLTAGGES